MMLRWLSIILGIGGVVALFSGMIWVGLALLALGAVCMLQYLRRIAQHLASPVD